MTPEQQIVELLKPRYKVIADYPNSPFGMDEILKLTGITPDGIPYCNDSVIGYWVEHKLMLYPHLFKPLFWYEEMEEKDMPEYVKRVNMDYKRSYIGIPCGSIDKVKIAFLKDGFPVIFGTDGDGDSIIMYDIDCFVPATKEEYESQSKK